jgi:hypothetical protein
MTDFPVDPGITLEQSTGRFPTAEQLAAAPTIQPCALVPELAEAGLRDHELLIEFVWYAPDSEPEDEEDDDEEVLLWPGWYYRIRRIGGKVWHSIGLSAESLSFAKCAGAGMQLMCYFADLEEALEDTVSELTYDEDFDEEDSSDSPSDSSN